MNTAANHFFERNQKWSTEFHLLREIISENTDLLEDFKWMHPCYTFNGKNIVLIHGFKEYCALLFHKGALMTDSEHILIQQTANVQAARQIRFTNSEQITELRTVIADYIREAVEIEQSGKKVEMKKTADYPVAAEFQQAMDDDAALEKAFHNLTPGRQKGYLFYFNQAKQASTRGSRIEKYYQHILDGKGLDDE
ncbi:YdeI/OmpD-associated family protein [Sphingobacterium spiritivorum]|uniref:YdeI/OmpD-associated family protein n=1 Tax=Sphingobacterium spiritivorum TaxID=258 RepID=UPI003DA619D4